MEEKTQKKADVNSWTDGLKVDFDNETLEFVITNVNSEISTRISYPFVVARKFSNFNDFFAYFKKRQKVTHVDACFTPEAIEVIDDVIKHNKRMTSYYQHLESIKTKQAPKED